MIGAILQGIPLVGGVWKTIFGDKAADQKAVHTEKMAVHDQYAAEFGHSKTWFDSFVDGMNRLVRPMYSYGMAYLFFMCWTDPVRFATGAENLTLIPREMWFIEGTIITFFFGGRLYKDFGKYKVPEKIKNFAVKVAAKALPNTTANEKHVDGVTFEERVEKRYRHSDQDGYNE